jgi:hypothetical protein
MLVPASVTVAETLNVEFPLCRDPRHEAAIRHVLVRSAEMLMERLPPGGLAALVLTGSFARGEGSVMASDSRLRVLGDIEFLAVLPGETQFHTFRTRMPQWGREVSEAVRDVIEVDVEFGPVIVDYFRRLARPSIFVYDLIRHGKVICGPADIVKHVTEFGPERIPAGDALHLLFNRTIEQLEAYDRTTALEGRALWDLAYQRQKLVLDLAGSALAFVGRHEPSYEARPAAFERLLAETPALRATLPAAFRAELERAARIKMSPGDGRGVLPPGLPLAQQREWIRDQIVAGVPAVAAFLHWELSEMLDDRQTELPMLLRRWARGTTLRRRIWDWAKVALHPVRPPLRLSRLRAGALFCRSTPRGLLYTAGALSYLNLARPTAAPAAIAALLPVRRSTLGTEPDNLRRAITSLWRWCVRNN